MQNKSNNKGSLIIIIILLVIGLVYLVINSSKQKEDKIFQENKNVISNSNISTKTYTNIKAEYSVKYPTNWELLSTNNSDNSSSNSFGIKNDNSSSIIIYVNFGLPFNQNKNYAEYKTIDDYIKDHKVSGTPQESISGYLSQVSSINIGGKLLRVRSEKAVNGAEGSVNDSYLFIYNGKSYAIGFDSANRTQYEQDHQVFTDFLSSFVLN